MLKLNMAIGVFFSEVGTKLLTLSSEFNPNIEELKQTLVITNEWSDKQLSNVSRQLKAYEYTIISQNGNLLALRTLARGTFFLSIRLMISSTGITSKRFLKMILVYLMKNQ